jgi:uncharacterized membrane protein YoaK (UPF0700 family)
MTRFDLKAQLLASGLSALAGYVDALGFIALGGFFVSFMSGNSTRLAVGIVQLSSSGAIAAGLISAFLLGVVLGSITGRLAGLRRRPVVIGFVSLLLASAALLNALGHRGSALALMPIAMGAENAVFEQGGDVRIGLTYMTGALVKAGQGVAGAFFGGDRLAWAPYLLLWSGLLVGAITGAAIYREIGLSSLWIAAGAGGGLALIASMSRDGQ